MTMTLRRLLPFIILSAASCKSLLDVDPPIDKVTNQAVYNSPTSATGVLTGILQQLNTDAFTYTAVPGMSADEFYMNNTFMIELYRNDLNRETGTGFWGSCYVQIYRCNSALEGLANATIPEALKRQLRGEAHFLRAVHYFYLVNYYGDVPLLTSSDFKENAVKGRTPAAEVYQLILEDLAAAEELLDAAYRAGDGTTPVDQRLRPNKAAASAMLARVHLYLGHWEDAENYAGKVIGDSRYMLTALNDAFRATSQEAIFQVQPADLNYNTEFAKFFILVEVPNNDMYSENFFSMSTYLYNAFEPGDKRKESWVGTFTDTAATPDRDYHYVYKYKVQKKEPAEPWSEYVMVLRLAEQYLIRAEARARQNRLTGSNGAAADLDAIRSRANLGGTAATGSQAAMLLAIEHERQVELFAEWGHRWLDLKRTGRANTVMPPITTEKGGTWDTNDQLYPIPGTEMDKNANLKPQNPGY